MPRVKPLSGQVTLLGEVFDLKLKYQPRISWSDDGLAVVVTRIPPGAHSIDVALSMKESRRLAKTIKSTVPHWKRKRA